MHFPVLHFSNFQCSLSSCIMYVVSHEHHIYLHFLYTDCTIITHHPTPQKSDGCSLLLCFYGTYIVPSCYLSNFPQLGFLPHLIFHFLYINALTHCSFTWLMFKERSIRQTLHNVMRYVSNVTVLNDLNSINYCAI